MSLTKFPAKITLARLNRLGAVLMLLILAAAPAALSQGNDEAALLLEAALQKENVDGELSEAIELYEQIATRFGDQRAIAARALLQMAGCYEKLGGAQARTTYDRLLRDYADQVDVVADARRRLAALEPPATAGEPNGVVTRQVWAEATDIAGQVTPDGRFLTFADWNTANLAVRDLVTGEVRLLTDVPHWNHEDYAGFAEVSILSPDASRVAYTWYNEVAGPDDFYDLRIVDMDGGGQRVLYRNPDVFYPNPMSWSPDGQTLVVALAFADGPDHPVVLLDVETGSSRRLIDPRPDSLNDGRLGPFTPDGRYVVASFVTGSEREDLDVSLLPVDGGPRVPLIVHPANDLGFAWTPDGRDLLFFSDRLHDKFDLESRLFAQERSLWAQRVADGRAVGDPRLIHQDMMPGIPLGLSRDGALFLGAVGGSRDSYVVPVDSDSGRVVGARTPISEERLGANGPVGWSPDGRYLAYATKGRRTNTDRESWGWIIRTVATGAERELGLNLGPPDFLRGRPVFSPDSSGLLLRLLSGATVLVGLESGVAETVTTDRIVTPRWAADGQTLYFLRQLEDRMALVRHDLATGAEDEPLGDLGHTWLPGSDISPDGRQLATAIRDSRSTPTSIRMSIRLVPLDGGPSRDLTTGRPFSGFPSVAWSPDGRSIWFGTGEEMDGRFHTMLCSMSIAGGEPQCTSVSTQANNGLFHIQPSPDGRHVSFQVNETHYEVWVVENLPLGANPDETGGGR